jgi:very-short-patch-repair endonuclease
LVREGDRGKYIDDVLGKLIYYPIGVGGGKYKLSLSRDPRLRLVIKQVCRDLRRSQTKAETIFWNAVRNRKFLGYKFYRQYPFIFDYIGKETFFVADFYCAKKRLVIELDGKIHEYQIERDELRTYIINMLGIRLVRFRNEEIDNNLNIVLEKLEKELS